MENKINEILARAKAALPAAKTKTEVAEISASITGPKGELTAAMKLIPTLDKAQRPVVGKLINLAKSQIEPLIAEAYARLENAEMAKALGDKPDATLPPCGEARGTIHPLTATIRKICDIFKRAGFTVAEASDLETEWYCFDALNTPANHPARDAQDTFYMDENIVLRTHTSPMQARAMLTRKPPIRIICPGRVYRSDEVDATHSPVFHQMEGLVVDEHVRMSDLRGTLEAFAKKLYGPEITTRFRPSFFPFTEPSAEVDLTCVNCHGKGCRICKGTGWIEVLGSGMVNPKVLEMCGIDPAKYSGFAFGIGLERIAMQRYGIRDMRLLYEGDARLLGQLR